jgi:hypothetical protein
MDNIKIDLREVGWDGMDWFDLAQDRNQWRSLVNRKWRSLVNMIMNLSVPLNIFGRSSEI